MKKIFLILLILPFYTLSFAQNVKQVSFFARSYSDHIVLRLFVNSPASFYIANSKGYIIEKALAVSGISNEKLIYVPVKGSPFKRLQGNKWDELLNNASPKDTANNDMVGLAFIYSDSITKPKQGDVLEKGMQSIKENRENESFKLMLATIAANRSKIAAKGLAQWIEDADVEVGKTYTYRVRLNEDRFNKNENWFYLKVACQNFNENYLRNDKIIKLKEGDTKVSFTFPDSDDYYAFEVERSIDNGQSFKRITRAPGIKLTPDGFVGKTDFVFADSNLTNYKKYIYRVLAATVFADNLLLSQFEAMPKDKTPPPPVNIKSATHIKPTEVEIVWEINDKEIKDLKGFNIKRSKFIDSAYHIISNQSLAGTTKKYIDNSFDKNGSNYYVIESVDTAGNSINSYPVYVTLIDSTPPAVPVVEKATIDSLGKITIKIKPNKETDFMGYQLLKANSEDHEFSVEQETYKDSLGATTFILYDSTTLQTLSPKIYYKLIAFDSHYNQSDFSNVIILKRPDTIPPVSPIITNFKVTDSSVTILFANSSSEDAVANYLLRKETGKQKFDTIFINRDTRIGSFTDTKITGGKVYEYTMFAKDEGGLNSKVSRSILIKTILNDNLQTPVFKGIYDDKAKNVQLTIEANDKLKGKKIKIEISKREDINSEWVLFKTLEFDNTNSFTDNEVKDKKAMIYIVRLVSDGKVSSNYSKPLFLKLGTEIK